MQKNVKKKAKVPGKAADNTIKQL